MSIVPPPNSEVKNQKVSKQEFKEFIARIDLSILNADQLRTILEQLKQLEQLEDQEELVKARTEFLTFFRLINPTFVIQEYGHHGKIARVFESLVDGDLKRVNISTPPRFTKSEMTSIALPAWVLGKNPKWKIIQASSTDVLATDFGRKVKNLIASDVYQSIFPGVTLSKDSKASGKFATNHGGEYYAVGVGGAIAGRGADVFIIDDATSEQEARSGDPNVYESAWTWFQSGPLQRLQPGGRLLNIACVEENQKVLTEKRGWIPIKDIQVGEKVWTWNESGKSESKLVNAVVNQGEDDLLCVSGKRISLTVNKRHPFLVAIGNGKDAMSSKDWHLEWRQAGDLKAGDFIVRSKSIQNGNGYRPTYVFGANKHKQVDQDFLWLLGFLFGDGWITVSNRKRGGQSQSVCCATSVYPDLNKKVVDLFEKYLGRPYLTKFGYIRLDNTESCRMLRRFGLNGKAKTKRIPDLVYRLRPCDKRAFMLGFFEADGWKFKPKGNQKFRGWRYDIGLCNRDLVEDLRMLAITCGVRPSKIYSQSFIAQPPNSKEPFLAYRHQCSFRFAEQMIQHGRLFGGQTINGLGRCFSLEKIESVEYTDSRGIVYDLSVDGNANFIAEGFVVHNTRWSKADIIGRIEKKMQVDPRADKYISIVFPALDENEESTFPKFWSTDELKAKRDNMAPHLWSAQYQQNPTSESSSIVPRTRWRQWDRYDERRGGFITPDCHYTIMAWDTAYTANKRSNPSACTIWGVFKHRDEQDPKEENHIILLSAFKRKMEPAILKQEAKRLIREWNPDTILIEAITSGAGLRSDLREAGIFTEPVRPKKGEDKTARLNSVSDLFYSNKVWYIPTSENEAVLQEVHDFPGGLEDDYTDTVGYTLRRFREGGFVRTIHDVDEPEEINLPREPNY